MSAVLAMRRMCVLSWTLSTLTGRWTFLRLLTMHLRGSMRRTCRLVGTGIVCVVLSMWLTLFRAILPLWTVIMLPEPTSPMRSLETLVKIEWTRYLVTTLVLLMVCWTDRMADLTLMMMLCPTFPDVRSLRLTILTGLFGAHLFITVMIPEALTLRLMISRPGLGSWATPTW